MTPNVRGKAGPAVGRQAREADDRPGCIAGLVARRWASPLTEWLGHAVRQVERREFRLSFAGKPRMPLAPAQKKVANLLAAETLRDENNAALTRQPKSTAIWRGETTWASRTEAVRECSPCEA